MACVLIYYTLQEAFSYDPLEEAENTEAAMTLNGLPDDIFLQVIAAFSDTEDGVPLFDAVKSLACLSKALLQQLHRLRPLVGA